MVSNVPKKLGFMRYALDFKPTDQHIKVPQSSSLNSFADTDELTVEILLYLRARPFGWSSLISLPGATGPGFNVHLDSRNFHLWLGLAGIRTHVIAFPYTDAFLKTWQHHTVTVKDGVSSWYINNTLQKTESHAADLTVAVGDLFINVGHVHFDGVVALTRTYNRALTSSEREWNLFNYHDPVQSGLTLWLPMEEGTGEIVYDKSEYGNNGTLMPAGAGPTWQRLRQWELRSVIE